jgi:nitrite reductase/ring-hydroxylating ferredoxin subunit
MHHPVCPEDALLDEQPLSFTLADPQNTRIILLKHQGECYAYLNRCPHWQRPLEWQDNDLLCTDTDLLRCATHGALFLLDSGLCVSGPCAGQALQPLEVTRTGTGWLAVAPP